MRILPDASDPGAQSPLADILAPDYWQYGTLVSLLRDRAEEMRDEVLYTFLSDRNRTVRTLTCSELESRALSIAAWLQRLVDPGSRALLLFVDGPDCIAALFGCFYAGVVAVSGVPASLSTNIDRFINIARDSGSAIVLGTSTLLAQAQHQAGDRLANLHLKWIATDQLPEGTAKGPEPSRVSNDSLAILQYTSGSTGLPRGVMLTHRNLLHNLYGQVKLFGYRRGDTGVSWLPFAHDMGLIGAVLMGLYGAIHCTMISPLQFVRQPFFWLEAISRLRATVSGGPNFAYEWCAAKVTDEQKARLDLSCWRIAFNGAEPVRAETIERFTDAFAPCGFRAEAMYPCYGLAEATLLVAGRAYSPSSSPVLRLSRSALSAGCATQTTHEDDAIGAVSCGASMDGLDVLVADPDKAVECSDGQIGEIWVAGPSVACGYFGHVEDTERTFGARLQSGLRPWLRTGDLGFQHQGQLYISGRLKDLIIIRGKNYYPHDIEATAQSSDPEIRPGCVIAFPTEHRGQEQLAVVCEWKRGTGDSASHFSLIHDAILKQHGIVPYLIASLAPGATPRTPNGKLQRRICGEQFERGVLPVLEVRTWDHEDYADSVNREVLRRWIQSKIGTFDVLRAVDFTNVPFADLNFDSLRIVQFKTELETLFGIRIDLAELVGFRDLAELESCLIARCQTMREPSVRRLQRLSAQTAHDGAVAELHDNREHLKSGRALLREQRLQRRVTREAQPPDGADTVQEHG